MLQSIYRFLLDRRGVVPLEYLHVATLVTAVLVTATHFIFG